MNRLPTNSPEEVVEELLRLPGAADEARLEELYRWQDLSAARLRQSTLDQFWAEAKYGKDSDELEAFQDLHSQLKAQDDALKDAILAAEIPVPVIDPAMFTLAGRVVVGGLGRAGFNVSLIDRHEQVKTALETDERGYFQLVIEGEEADPEDFDRDLLAFLRVTSSEGRVRFRSAEAYLPIPGSFAYRDVILADIEGEGIDLIADGITVVPDPAASADPIRLTAVVKNLGQKDAGTFKVNWSLQGVSDLDEDAGPLAAGQESTHTHDVGPLAAGRYAVRFTIDPAGELDLIDPQAATAKRSFEVRDTQVRLVAKNLTWDPKNPIPGERVKFTAVLLNEGTSATGPFLAQWTIDGADRKEETLNNLAAGQSRNLTFSPMDPLAGGHYEICLIGDSQAQLPLVDRVAAKVCDNLVVVQDVSLVHLKVESIDVVPSSPRADDRLEFSVTVRNYGDIPSLPYDWRLTLDGGIEKTEGANPLPARQSAPFTIKVGRQPVGSHDATFTIEHADLAHPERATKSLSFTVAKAEILDLRATNLDWSPASPAPDQMVTLTCTLENVGSVSADQVEIRWEVDKTVVGQDKIELRPGQSRPFSKKYRPPVAGKYRVCFIAGSELPLANRAVATVCDDLKVEIEVPTKPGPRALVDLSGIGNRRVEQLAAAGITTVEGLAAATPEAVAEAPGIGPGLAEKLIEEAKKR